VAAGRADLAVGRRIRPAGRSSLGTRAPVWALGVHDPATASAIAAVET
jgi:hypothetical protein